MAETKGLHRLGVGRVKRGVVRRMRTWTRRPARRGGQEGQAAVIDGVGVEWLKEFSFPAALNEIPTARRRVADVAEACGLTGPALFDLLLAVGEALANAVKHGSPRQEADRVRVRVGREQDGVVVEVHDQGCGFGVSRLCPPEVLESGGRGIPFMRALVDELRFDCGARGTSVVLLKRIG